MQYNYDYSWKDDKEISQDDSNVPYSTKYWIKKATEELRTSLLLEEMQSRIENRNK